MEKFNRLKLYGYLGFAFFFGKGLLWIAALIGFGKITSTIKNQQFISMKVAVFDTYVTKKDGNIMHFDILVPDTLKDTAQIYAYGRYYLAQKGQEGQTLSTKECKFCHVEQADEAMEKSINSIGYFIIEMQGCN
jgi:hypothetical protein